jgi:hypothetical protein
MLIGFADRHDGQEEHIDVIGQARHNLSHHAFA